MTAWLLGGVRSPFGKLGGGLSGIEVVDLGSQVARHALSALAVDDERLDELLVGMALIEGGLMVPARQVAARAGLPMTLPTLTVDRACCSGLTTAGLAMRAVADVADVVLCLGLESMSTTPRLLHGTRSGVPRGDLVVEDLLLMRSPLTGGPIATYVGQVALARGIDRRAQDAWALQSHERYHRALDAGYFDDEIVEVEGSDLAADESPRRTTSMEKLGRLPTVYDSPTVTPGNAPGLSDGACAVVVASERYIDATGRTPLARLVAYRQEAGDATSSAYLPGEAIRGLLDQTGLGVGDLDVIEINEAFAATAPVSLKVLAGGDTGLEAHLTAITNPNGGAVAIGHPTGASGSRLLLTAARHLARTGRRYGAVAICGGFGQTDAVIIERVDAA